MASVPSGTRPGGGAPEPTVLDPLPSGHLVQGEGHKAPWGGSRFPQGASRGSHLPTNESWWLLLTKYT